MRGMTIATIACVFFLVGCGDPLVGKWEADGNQAVCTGTGEFEVDNGDLEGDGDITVPAGGVCTTCSFDVEGTNDGGGDYTLEMKFGNCTINGKQNVDFECELDGDSLECKADDIDLKSAGYDDWDRAD